MSTLLEITRDDIAQLNDADLRSLIGLLCEADYRAEGLSTKGITWGGNQDAKDGGVDVRVRTEVLPTNGSVPNRRTIFQSKKSKIPQSKILDEMRPMGILRDAIKTLIQENGAYVIVSSGSSTSDAELEKRVNAMKKAVEDENNHQNLHLDFLDRGRVATWVRTHPALILWVLNKIGRPLTGWYPYGNWAHTPEGIENEYLLDDGLRLQDGSQPQENSLSAADGIERLRSILNKPGASVRLTGLSGVGKTRLVQALFEEGIGEKALNLHYAFYTDISYSPSPAPEAFAGSLMANKTRAILVVDNCPPDLHRRLTQLCSGSQSMVSLLTVEYDVLDDRPEETSVYRLEPASEELIAKLIHRRFMHINQFDAQTIANFSGGNARIAIALANTVQSGETLSRFRDEELFKRLFWQRNDRNDNLLISAQACSLVYSFDGENTDTESSELKFLATLAGKSILEIFREVNELKNRDLVQSRSIWRAVLPHAISNRLAKDALQSIPKSTIVQVFLSSGSVRLIKSFTRRLSYLHDCVPAVEIVDDWLDQKGWIGAVVSNLDSFRMEVLKNIAPVSPKRALEAIERAANGEGGDLFTSRENTHYYEFAKLLRSLAYDRDLFDRSVRLLCRFAISEKSTERHNSTRDILKSLFRLFLSGTHASIEARAKIIEELVDSQEQDSQNLGLLLLEMALEAWSFSSSQNFSFGARLRDSGYKPIEDEDIYLWYETFVTICTRVAISNQLISKQARKILAKKLHGLWTRFGMVDIVENAAKQIHKQQAWNEGWIAVKKIIRRDRGSFEIETLERLRSLEKFLKPSNLLQSTRTYVLLDRLFTYDLEDEFDDQEDASSRRLRVEETTRILGEQVAQDADIYSALLPELVSTDNPRLFIFGNGLANGCREKSEFWKSLYEQLEKTPPEKRHIGVILGFLTKCAEIDPTFYNLILDSSIRDNLLAGWFPILQTTSTIDQRGIKRLHQALDLGVSQIGVFCYIAYGCAHEAINDDDLADLLRKIVTKENGLSVAIEILKMRFLGSDKEVLIHSGSLILMAQNVLSMYILSTENRNDNSSHALSEIASVCLKGEAGKLPATQIYNQALEAVARNSIYIYEYFDLFNKIACVQPKVFLDSFLGDDRIKDYQHIKMFSDDYESSRNPINQIPDNQLIEWCDYDPESRYPLIAAAIQPFSSSTETKGMVWKPIVHSIFEKAPDLGAVLQHLAYAIVPTSWSGSRADILQTRSVLFQNLYEHENPEISAWARKQYRDFQAKIESWREREARENRRQNESFE